MNWVKKLIWMGIGLVLFVLVTLLSFNCQTLAFSQLSSLSPTHEEILANTSFANQDTGMKTRMVKKSSNTIKDRDFLKVTLNAGCYHWQIRKPGTFTAEPLSIDIHSNRAVLLTFSRFNDLKSSRNEELIPAFYGYGATLDEVERNGWIRALRLNGLSIKAVPDSAGTHHFTWKIWPKIEITKTTQAGEYEDTGYLTVTILETQNYVENCPEKSIESKWNTGWGETFSL